MFVIVATLRYLPLLFVATLLTPSCTFRPSIDAEGNITTRPTNKIIRSHGISEFEKFKQSNKISTNPHYTVPVQRVAQRLQRVIDMPGSEWEFVIFKDNSPNAFALPGGKVGINTGIFRIIGRGKNSDAMLAAVLGHEISHATANHAEQRMYRALALGLAGAALWYALDHNDHTHPEHTVAAFTLGTYLLNILPFSRKQEYESDRIGAIYMAKAGYDPRFSIELWRRLQRHHAIHGSHKPQFLRTHPLDNARIEALKKFMPVAMKHYRRKKQ